MESTPEEKAEGANVVFVLAAVLERLIGANTSLAQTGPGKVTKFHALKAPGIGIQKYLERIHKYASCSKECFVLALIYIDRLIQRNNFLLTQLNVHRVVITAVLLAAKFFDDAYYNNAYYAKVGGVLVSEMNSLEVEFLFRINFSLHVSPEVFHKYRSELAVHAVGPCQDQPEPQLQYVERIIPTNLCVAVQASTALQQPLALVVPTSATRSVLGCHHNRAQQITTPSPPHPGSSEAVLLAAGTGTCQHINPAPTTTVTSMVHTVPTGPVLARHDHGESLLQRHHSMPSAQADRRINYSIADQNYSVESCTEVSMDSRHAVGGTSVGAMATAEGLGYIPNDSHYAMHDASDGSMIHPTQNSESPAVLGGPCRGHRRRFSGGAPSSLVGELGTTNGISQGVTQHYVHARSTCRFRQ